MTIGESRNVDWPVNQELRLAAQLLLHHINCITEEAAPIRLTISRSMLSSLVNKTPRYLNSSTCSRNSPPTWSGQATFLQLLCYVWLHKNFWMIVKRESHLMKYDIYQQSPMVPAKVWPLGPTWINHVKFVFTHPSLLFIDQCCSIIASSN